MEIGREISVRVTDGVRTFGLFIFLRNSCLLIKERLQKYSSKPAHHSILYQGNLRMMFNEMETTV